MLQNAVANGVRIDVVNPMVFDYYDRVTTRDGRRGGQRVAGAARAARRRSSRRRPTPQIWAMQGATMMNGVDDYPKRTEVTDLGDAQQLLDFASPRA